MRYKGRIFRFYSSRPRPTPKYTGQRPPSNLSHTPTYSKMGQPPTRTTPIVTTRTGSARFRTTQTVATPWPNRGKGAGCRTTSTTTHTHKHTHTHTHTHTHNECAPVSLCSSHHQPPAMAAATTPAAVAAAAARQTESDLLEAAEPVAPASAVGASAVPSSSPSIGTTVVGVLSSSSPPTGAATDGVGSAVEPGVGAGAVGVEPSHPQSTPKVVPVASPCEPSEKEPIKAK